MLRNYIFFTKSSVTLLGAKRFPVQPIWPPVEDSGANCSGRRQAKETMTLQNGTILIVEDDPFLRRTLRIALTALHFHIGEASTGEEALSRLRLAEFELVLLDINMPGMGGLEACRQIRRLSFRLPIVMLTVRANEDDKVRALEAGADDYVTKPFKIRELAARIRSAIRRYRAPEPTEAEPLTVGDITLDPLRRRVTKAGIPVHLTPRELSVLRLLMENAGVPLTHERLLTDTSGPESAQNREYLRVLMNNLRRKLERDPARPEYLLTESYFGYRFRDK
jgi:two-component system, OmpR family, KDP operon response regulator KdpE